MQNDKLLHVNASSNFLKYYDGPAISISATNKKGDFDILYGHINFISLISKCILLIDKGEDFAEGRIVQIPVTEGVITVSNNIVYIFVNV